MADVGGRHPLALQRAPAERSDLAGMDRVQPVRHAAPQPVELDPLVNKAASLGLAGAQGIEMVGLQHLELQRHRQPVNGAAGPHSDQTLAAFHHGPGNQRLQAMEVSAPVGVALCREPGPQLVGRIVKGGVAGSGAGLEAAAHQVADQGVHPLGGIGVVSHQVPRAVPEPGQCGGDLGACAAAGRPPAFGPPA